MSCKSVISTLRCQNKIGRYLLTGKREDDRGVIGSRWPFKRPAEIRTACRFESCRSQYTGIWRNGSRVTCAGDEIADTEMVFMSKYSKELLTDVSKDCISVMGVLRKLHLKETGGSHRYISSLIQKYNIDTSHFLGSKSNSGIRHIGGNKKKSAEEVLILRSNNRREDAFRLRRAMIEFGILYACDECKLCENWNGKPILLQIDHQNGNYRDNRIENLRFLCPNCHSQTPNFGSKKKGNKSGNKVGLTRIVKE